MLSLRIDGIDAKLFGYGAPSVDEVAHLWSSKGGGLQYVKFGLALPARYSHPALVEGALVEVVRGTVSLGTAVLSDVDREGWIFTADGLFRRAEHFNAEGASNAPSVVVAAANARGLGWNGVGNLPATAIPVGDNTRLATVADVLNEYCRLNNKRWGLGFDGTPYVADDPVSVSCALRPGTPRMATADDDYVSRVVVRYVSEVDGDPLAPSAWGEVSASSTNAPYGAREAYEDISSMGLLAEVDAQSYADALITANSARRGFVEGIEVAPGQLTTLGSVPIDGWMACREALGRLVLQHNILETDGRQAFGQTRQWVIGSTIYKVADRSLTLTPVGLLPRTIAQAFAGEASTDLRTRAGITT